MAKPMRTSTVTLLAVAGCLAQMLSGCAKSDEADESQELLAHRIVIPEEYQWGKGSPHFLSPAERYLHAYDQAWWACISDFAAKIDYRSSLADHAGNGWQAAVAGYSDGYSAAEAKVTEIRRKFGDRKAQELLKNSLEFPP